MAFKFRAGPPARALVLLGTSRACFLCGRSGSGPDPGRTRARPGLGPARPDPGPWHLGVLTVDLGGCWASRPWDSGLRPHCPHPAGSLTVCVSGYTVTVVAPRARASGPGLADGSTLRHRRARLAGILMAPRRLARWGSGPPSAPSCVLARTWSWLSASSPAGAASVIEFSRFVALAATSLPLDAPASRGSGGPLPSRLDSFLL